MHDVGTAAVLYRYNQSWILDSLADVNNAPGEVLAKATKANHYNYC